VRSRDEEDPVVTHRENMVAVTEDDSAGQPPAAGGPGTDAAPEPASEPAGDVADADGAAEAGAPAEASGQDGPGQAVADETAAAPDETAAAPDETGGALDETGGALDETGGALDETGGALDADEDDEEAPDSPGREVADLEQEQEIAADYLEGLLDIVGDPDSEFDMGVEGDRALVSVVGGSLRELIGPRGEVLEALQELTRLAVHRQTGERTRLMLDVGGYRARRRTELTALGRDAAEDVSRTGVARRLEPMTPFERKIVHDAVAAAGLRSESEGEEPNRRVVVLPAG
jgi:spoIIIJ-associated protein